MALTGVTNAHGPLPQPTACRSPSCSLTTATGNNQAKERFKPTSPEKSGVDGGSKLGENLLIVRLFCKYREQPYLALTLLLR